MAVQYGRASRLTRARAQARARADRTAELYDLAELQKTSAETNASRYAKTVPGHVDDSTEPVLAATLLHELTPHAPSSSALSRTGGDGTAVRAGIPGILRREGDRLTLTPSRANPTASRAHPNPSPSPNPNPDPTQATTEKDARMRQGSVLYTGALAKHIAPPPDDPKIVQVLGTPSEQVRHLAYGLGLRLVCAQRIIFL